MEAKSTLDGGGPVECAAMPDTDAVQLNPDDFSGPLECVIRDGTEYWLLGTAHVSQESANDVTRALDAGAFDAVALELDRARHEAIVNPDAAFNTDVLAAIRAGRGGAMLAQLALGAFQQRLAEQHGIEPGQEMREAVSSAEHLDLPVWLVDREIGVTLRRVYAAVPWWKRWVLFGGLLGSVVSNEKIDAADVEALKEGDVLEATFAEFAADSSGMYAALIDERDQYMANRLGIESSGATPGRVLVVIGAGHLKGLKRYLSGDEEPLALEELTRIPPTPVWVKAVPWLIVAVILSGFAWGFVRDPDLGRQLLSDWFVINAVSTAFGAALAAAHPVTVMGSMLAAPFTSLNPTVGAGVVAAALEVWRRRPTVGDVATLRRSTTTLKGWYRNRVSRTLLVFAGATLGSAVGTYVAGFRIFSRLF